MHFLAIFLALSSAVAHADGIIERRIWIETAVKQIQENVCVPEVKVWHCLFPDRIQCGKILKELYSVSCSNNLLPDLPEYIDGPETKAQAIKLVTDCLTTEVTKKYVLPLPREKLEEFNVCTGVAPRTKPMNPHLQRALDFSKSQTTSTCAGGGFLRKCFSLSQASCDETLKRQQNDCALKMEKDGVAPKDEASSEEAGRKITDCALREMRKMLDATRKRVKDKDCE